MHKEFIWTIHDVKIAGASCISNSNMALLLLLLLLVLLTLADEAGTLG